MTSQKISLPEQINPVAPADTARAPYNFVQLNQQLVTLKPQADLPDQDTYVPKADEKSWRYGSQTINKRYTGTITCRLTTETPLYIRAPLPLAEYQKLDSEEDKKAHYDKRVKNRPDFYYTDPVNKTPRIPGSTLRGMLRTLVEIVGHGKFEAVTDRKLVYRAVGDTTSHGNHYRDQIMYEDERGRDERDKLYYAYTPLVQAGYLVYVRGEWQIWPAQNVGGATFARVNHRDLQGLKLTQMPGCKNAYDLYIQPGEWKHQLIRGGLIRTRFAKTLEVRAQPRGKLLKGALAYSGPIFSKRTEAVVFPLDPAVEPISVSDDLIRDYQDQISQEQQKLLGPDGLLSVRRAVEELEQKKESTTDEEGLPLCKQPVFYIYDDEKLLFFGHTMMMRLPYQRSPKALVPEALRNEATTDLAEAIFGYTKSSGKGKARAYAGRVFVNDAVLEPEQQEIWLAKQPVVPKILASPKPTAFQHYLVQQTPNPVVIGQDRRGDKYQKQLGDYASLADETTLRGYKLYRHKQGQVTLNEIREPDKEFNQFQKDSNRRMRDSQYTQMQPVKPGVTFRFTINFENLAAHELGALLWCITLPDAAPATRQYRHKIGMGKPYGMGTVRLEPTLQLEDRQARYSRLFADSTDLSWHLGTDAPTLTESATDLVHLFEQFMQEQLATPDFRKLPRIQVLLNLLAWPGMEKNDQTRYLEIERDDPGSKRGKRNEYKERPVLPHPLPTPPQSAARRPANRPERRAPKVVAPPARPPERRPTANATAARVLSTLQGKTDPVPMTPAVGPENIEMPTTKEAVKPGMWLMGKVVRVEPNRIVVNVGVDEATLPLDQTKPILRDRAVLEEQFPPGLQVRVRVRTINQKGRIQLTMREA